MSFRLEGIARLYNNLFALPSSPLVLALTILAHISVGSLLFPLCHSSWTLSELADGALWGFASLLPASLLSILLSDLAVGRERKFWSIRRLTGLSLFSIVFWSIPAFLGAAFHVKLQAAASLGVLSGLGLISFLRVLVFRGASNLSIIRSLTASSTHPLLIAAALVLSNFTRPSIAFFMQFAAMWILLTAAGYLYLHIIDKAVEKELGVGGLRLLYGFMAEWLSEEPQPLEEALTKIGSIEEREVLVLSFISQERPAVSLIVPMVHPGPFRKVGGATLPYVMAKAFEEQVGGLAGVAHGASTHAQNPVSRFEVVKLAEEVIKAAQLNKFKLGKPVSPLVQVERGPVRVGCQLFGDLALFTVSLTSCSYDDVHPSMLTELSKRLAGEWNSDIFMIDAHSASEGRLELEPLTPSTEIAEEIIVAATNALRAAKTLKAARVKAGGGHASVLGAGVKEGIGSGGVFSLLLDVEGHVSCYIIVDGNNMMYGLRESIRRRVEELGVHAVEVLTSDSHETNAVSIGERGSNPVGFSVDWNAVIDAALSSVEAAKKNMEEAEPTYFIEKVKVKVIGENSMTKLSLSVQKAASLAKKATVIPFLSLLALAALFLL
ncbi:MAG: DUF2070 family protein [Candidatus Jordarchaeales archaeon]